MATRPRFNFRLRAESRLKNEPSPIQPVWQRWNDYGIGLLLEGGDKGGQKGELKQAEPVFLKVAELGAADGWVNLARVYQKEGRIPEALAALEKAADARGAACALGHQLADRPDQRPQRTVRRGDRRASSRSSHQDSRARRFDLSLDYEVNNELACACTPGPWTRRSADSPERRDYLKKAIATYRRTLAIDSENVAAHYGLGLAYGDAAWGRRSRRLRPKAEDDRSRSSPTSCSRLARDHRRSEAQPAERAGREPQQLAGERRRPIHEGPRPQYQSRLEPLYEIVEILGPAWDTETDPRMTRSALARALEVTHRRLHERLKPDETAEGQAFAVARKIDPAANQNAQSIVIHSLASARGAGDRCPGLGQVALRPRKPLHTLPTENGQ